MCRYYREIIDGCRVQRASSRDLENLAVWILIDVSHCDRRQREPNSMMSAAALQPHRAQWRATTLLLDPDYFLFIFILFYFIKN